jgi:hypothetical protein
LLRARGVKAVVLNSCLTRVFTVLLLVLINLDTGLTVHRTLPKKSLAGCRYYEDNGNGTNKRFGFLLRYVL